MASDNFAIGLSSPWAPPAQRRQEHQAAERLHCSRELTAIEETLAHFGRVIQAMSDRGLELTGPHFELFFARHADLESRRAELQEYLQS